MTGSSCSLTGERYISQFTLTPEDELSSEATVVSEGSVVVVLSAVVSVVDSEVEEVAAEVLSEMLSEILSEEVLSERLLASDILLWHALAEKSENKTELASKNVRVFLNFFMVRFVSSFRSHQINTEVVLHIIFSNQCLILKKHLAVGSG